MKKIVISCGPIPARLDSVKYVTNRFKGGLAYETAKYLMKNRNYQVTIVKWEHAKIEGFNNGDIDAEEIVNVRDVDDYYQWFNEHACDYDAFILAAAVANLEPTHPWPGKFPSHQYNEGDCFPIEFKIAPRAIDIIKKKNPRACLVGYKLFDTEDMKELGDIAAKTLADSKANVIFANTPKEAADWKLAVMQDGTRLKLSFGEHLALIEKAINADFFRTEVTPLTEEEWNNISIRRAFAIVEMFEKTFPHYGTVAIPIPGTTYFATTSRGHNGGPVLVRKIKMRDMVICASGKATLNAPTLDVLLHSKIMYGSSYKKWEDVDIVVHRHINDSKYQSEVNANVIPYEFPGSYQEASAVQSAYLINNTTEEVVVEGHGSYYFRKIVSVDWNKYYNLFPARYFRVPQQIQDAILQHKGQETLEIGGNTHVDTKYAFDPYVPSENAINQTKEEVLSSSYDLIVAKNSINYLEREFIQALLARTKEFIANTFLVPPEKKVTHEEAAVYDSDSKTVFHHLLLKSDDVMLHSFFAYLREDYEAMGFQVEEYGKNSALLRYTGNPQELSDMPATENAAEKDESVLVRFRCHLSPVQEKILKDLLASWGIPKTESLRKDKVILPVTLIRERACENELWVDNLYILVDSKMYEECISCPDIKKKLEKLADNTLRAGIRKFLASKTGWYEICRSALDFNWGDMASCYPLPQEGIFDGFENAGEYEVSPYTVNLKIDQDEHLAPTDVRGIWCLKRIDGTCVTEKTHIDFTDGSIDLANYYGIEEGDECYVVLDDGSKLPCAPEEYYQKLANKF